MSAAGLRCSCGAGHSGNGRANRRSRLPAETSARRGRQQHQHAPISASSRHVASRTSVAGLATGGQAPFARAIRHAARPPATATRAAQVANPIARPPDPAMHAESTQPIVEAERRQDRPPGPQHLDGDQHRRRRQQPPAATAAAAATARERTATRNDRRAMTMRAPRPKSPRERSQIPRRLGGEIGLPDDQQLHEIEIDPQHDQREQQLAEIGPLAASTLGPRSAARPPTKPASPCRRRHHAVDRRGELGSSDIVCRSRRRSRCQRQHDQPDRRDAAAASPRAGQRSPERTRRSGRPRRARRRTAR